MYDIVSPSSSGEGWRGGFYHSLSHTLTSVEFCSLTRMSSEFEIEVPPLLISKDSAIMCTVLRFTTRSAGFIYLIIIKNFELRFSFPPLFLHLSIEGEEGLGVGEGLLFQHFLTVNNVDSSLQLANALTCQIINRSLVIVIVDVNVSNSCLYILIEAKESLDKAESA